MPAVDTRHAVVRPSRAPAQQRAESAEDQPSAVGETGPRHLVQRQGTTEPSPWLRLLLATGGGKRREYQVVASTTTAKLSAEFPRDHIHEISTTSTTDPRSASRKLRLLAAQRLHFHLRLAGYPVWRAATAWYRKTGWVCGVVEEE